MYLEAQNVQEGSYRWQDRFHPRGRDPDAAIVVLCATHVKPIQIIVSRHSEDRSRAAVGSTESNACGSVGQSLFSRYVGCQGIAKTTM